MVNIQYDKGSIHCISFNVSKNAFDASLRLMSNIWSLPFMNANVHNVIKLDIVDQHVLDNPEEL